MALWSLVDYVTSRNIYYKQCAMESYLKCTLVSFMYFLQRFYRELYDLSGQRWQSGNLHFMDIPENSHAHISCYILALKIRP